MMYRSIKWQNSITGSTKRNFPLPIFQNEPMGRINEYTYSAMASWSESWWLPKETNKKGRAHFWPRLALWQSIEKTIFLTAYEFFIFVYSIRKGKNMIGIIRQNPFNVCALTPIQLYHRYPIPDRKQRNKFSDSQKCKQLYRRQ